MEVQYNWRWCFLCQRKYSFDVFSVDQESSDNCGQQNGNIRVVPVKSAVCYHTLCLSCVEQQSLDLSNNKDDYFENQHPTVICPVCRKADAFCAEEPILSLLTCKVLKREATSMGKWVEETKQDDCVGNEETDISPQFSNCCKRPPSEDESNKSNSYYLESLKPKDLASNKLKYKPDIYVFQEEPPLPFSLQHHNLSDKNNTPWPDEESSGNLESGEESYDLQPSNGGYVTPAPVPLPVRPTTLPGAVWVDGPHFNSAEEENYEERSISNDLPEPYLAIGTLVIDPPIVHAKPWVPFFVKYRRWLFGVSVVVVIVIAVVLAVEIPKQKRTATRTTSLKNIAFEVSGQSSVNGLGFSQKKSLDWILGPYNTRFDAQDDKEQIMQRYLLATLYHSTAGENWTKSGTFLSADDECNWFKESIICSKDQRVTNITLGETIFFFDEHK